MRNPFSEQPVETPEDTAEASRVFACLGEDALSPEGAQTIGRSMLAALSAAGRATATPRRLGIAGAALVGPLFVVSAVGAATGESPLEGPSTAIESVAASVGIGGNSGDVRQDIENRSETAGDNGQPGSQPGNTENVPGLQEPDADETDSGVPEPTAPKATTEDPGTTVDALDDPDDADAVAPHENGKGCDDVLFGSGAPPFATPGGPAGCEVGNSADHRQNGAREDDGDGDAEEPTETPDDATEDDDAEEGDSPGGVSHGLGRGHDEDRPGKGPANGHDKHGHEPNTNGHGPGGPSDDDGEDGEGEEPAPEEPAPVAPEDSTAPGNSGNAMEKRN